MKVSLTYPGATPTFYPPLGILSIGTLLREKGVDVDVRDLSFGTLSDFREYLGSARPDVVGFSCVTPIVDRAFEAARLAKSQNPDCVVVLGGPHPTALPEDTVRNPNVDVVVVGEGEMTFLDLVHDLDKGTDLSQVSGIYYKAKGIVRRTTPRPPIHNLDALPIPDRKLLPTFGKNLTTSPPYPMGSPCTPVIFGRGCPYSCAFCQPLLRKVFGKEVRLRSVQKVVDEIEYLLEDFKVKFVWFSDDTLTSSKKWAKALCKEIIDRGLHREFKWFAQTRVNLFDADIARMMKRAGCIFVAFGVESGSQEIRDSVLKKGITNDQIRVAFRVCHDEGMLSEAALIIGCPGESKSTLDETIETVKEIKPDVVDVHYLTPLPGSALYDSLKNELPDSGDWKMLDRYKVGSTKLSGLTEEELEASYLEVYKNFHRYKSLRRSVVSWLRYVANTISVWGFVRGMRTLSWALFNANPLSPTMFLQENWRYGSLFRCILLPFLTMKRLRRQRTPRRIA